MKLRAIVLGCGSSGGVPRLGGPDGRGDWGACDPDEPKNRRQRSSILVQRADDERGWDTPRLTSVLVDTSPDLREQLLDAGITRLDGVVMTHDHADQAHGMDDLRALVLVNGERIPVYLTETTCPTLLNRFGYCFESSQETGYPAILRNVPIEAGRAFRIDGPTGPLPIMPVRLHHGRVDALGFRFGNQDRGGLIYSPDTNGVPEESWPYLMSSDLWIVDALRYTEHVSHNHVGRALDWLGRSDARRGVLTNLHIDLDYRRLADELPDHVSPAYDGMVIELA